MEIIRPTKITGEMVRLACGGGELPIQDYHIAANLNAMLEFGYCSRCGLCPNGCWCDVVKLEDFEVLVPNEDGTLKCRVKIQIPVKWDKELELWILTPEAHELIEKTKREKI